MYHLAKQNPSETHPSNDNHQLLRDSFDSISTQGFLGFSCCFWSEFHVTKGLTQEQMVALREKYDLDGDQTLTLVPSFEETDLHETGVGGGLFYNDGVSFASKLR